MPRTLSILVLFLFVSLPVTAQQSFVVTNSNDSGPGSFRAALQSVADGPRVCFCRVEFRIDEPVPDAGFFTIKVNSLLPILEVTESLLIDGATQTALTGDTNPNGPEVVLDGTNVAELGPGLRIVDCAACEVRDLAIRHFRGNGIHLARGAQFILGNLDLSDNGWNGLLLYSSSGFVTDSTFRRNGSNGIFGAGSFPLLRNSAIEGNGANGIDMIVASVLTTANSVITGNAHHGVRVEARSLFRSSMDRIWGNGLLPIERGQPGPDPVDRDDTTPDTPTITIAEGVQGLNFGRVDIRGTVTAFPNTDVELTFYASPTLHPLGFAEGRFIIGTKSVRTDANGVATFDTEGFFNVLLQPLPAAGFISVMARDFDYGASELSKPLPFRTNAILVTSAEDAGPGTLRAAIETANARECRGDAACWIGMDLPEGTAIEPRSPLPSIVKDNIRVDGNLAVELLGRSAGDADGLRIDSAIAIVTGLRIRGFARDGLVVSAPAIGTIRIGLADLQLLENANGLRLRGGRLRRSLFNDDNVAYSATRIAAMENRGHGFVIEGDNHAIFNSRAEHNGGHGFFVSSGVLQNLNGVTALHNGGAGIASAPGAIGVTAQFSSTADNGGLGIDRNADGVTPNDVTETDRILDTPEILSAHYDEARQRTIVTYTSWNGIAPQIVPPLEIFSGTFATTAFYVSEDRDPSGRGEGAQGVQPEPSDGRPTGPSQTIEIRADLRGRWLSATRSTADCHAELGCPERDTSEFSNAVKVE